MLRDLKYTSVSLPNYLKYIKEVTVTLIMGSNIMALVFKVFMFNRYCNTYTRRSSIIGVKILMTMQTGAGGQRIKKETV